MNKYFKIAKISPFISTGNIGDYIISDYCEKIFSELFGEYVGISLPSREKISRVGRQAILTSDYTFVCGTNLLSSNILRSKQWDVDLMTRYKIASSIVTKREIYKINKIKNNLSGFHIILLGVGWQCYQGNPTLYTKIVLSSLLDTTIFHSVRDSYTEQKLKEIGIKNIINTACPTMWRLTEEFCSHIPQKKQDTVVTTITDYRKDVERDKLFLDILLSSYKTVYLWLQSYEDIAYLENLGYSQRVKIISPTLKCYDEFLRHNDTDYIGTRLHAGIRALNFRKRSCIIGVDNRALEISKDTKLPVVKEENISSVLKEWIYAEQPTVIRIPSANIKKWKLQFIKGNV